MENPEQPSDSAKHAQHHEEIYELRLYVVGDNKKSHLVFENLKEICNKYLGGKCRIEVIDLTKNPSFAKEDQIVAIPTLIRKNYSGKKIVGDLSNPERILEFLGLRTSNLMSDVDVKGSLKKTPAEESRTDTMKSKRSKDDLQPYIGSGFIQAFPKLG